MSEESLSVEQTEQNITRSYVIDGLRVLGSGNLRTFAQTIATLTECAPSKPLDDYGDEELRELLIKGVENIKENPQRMIGLHKFLDAVMRAELMQGRRARKTANPAAVL